MNKKGKNNPMWGKHHSEATKIKMRKAGKGRKFTEIHRTRISETNRGKEGLKAKDNPNWRGGKKLSAGYVLIWKPNHPHSDINGYVRRSRLIAEKVLGRYLKRIEIVHHRNKDRADDEKYNLLICTQGYHRSLHILLDKITRDRRGRFLTL